MGRKSVARTGNSGLNRKAHFRETILQAASSLFVEKGFGGTNVHDISSALGISRPALYYYFKSKEAILESLVDSFTVVAKEQARSIATQSRLEPTTAPSDELSRAIATDRAGWVAPGGHVEWTVRIEVGPHGEPGRLYEP